MSLPYACPWPHHARVHEALPCTCAWISHAQSRAMIEVPRTILASPNIQPPPHPPLQAMPNCPYGKKTHFKKGLPWSSQRPFDIIFNRTFLGIRWSSNHHTTLLKIVAIFFYQAHWAWIFNSENKMEKQDKPSLLKMIRKLVYSRTNEEFNNEWQTMKRNQTFLKYEKYAQLINE